MSFSALFFLTTVSLGFFLGLFKNPTYALLTYIFIYFNIPDPQIHWWASDVPQLRWAFISAGVCLLGMFLKPQYTASLSFPDTPNAKWLILFFLLLLVISPFGVNPTHSFESVYDFLRYVVAFIFIIKCMPGLKQYRQVIWLYLISCSYLAWNGWVHGKRVAGRLEGIGTPDSFDSNLLALLLVTSLPFIGAFILHGRKYERLTAIIMAPFIVNTIILCSSRGAFIAAVVCAIVFIFLDKYRGARKKALLGVLLGSIMFLNLVDAVYLERLLTLKSSSEPDEESDDGRTRIKYWIAGLQMAKDYPMGAGGKSFQDLSPYYLSRELLWSSGDVQGRSSHNTLILLLVENGFLGLMIFIIFLVSTLGILHRTRERILKKPFSVHLYQAPGDVNEFIFSQTVALESSLIGLLCGSFFVNRLYFEPLYWLCAFAPVLSNLYGTQEQSLLEAFSGGSNAEER